MDRPNFVLIVADQLRADCLACFGHPLVQTPHIDALAAAGTRFSEAYVQHPVCSPSRVSFLTGWYPHVRGHRSLTHLLRADEPNLLRLLKEDGYHVTWAGARGDMFAPGVTELSVHEYGCLGEPESRWGRPFPSEQAARLFYRGRVGPGRADHDELAVAAAEARLAAPPRGPWVLFVALEAPHCPFQVTVPWYSMYDREAIGDPIPPSRREARFKAAIRQRHGLDRVPGATWREVAAVYLGMISRLDDHVGRITKAVANSGQQARTVTLFFSDHGEYLGDFGLIEKWPSAMDRCITRTPLIIAGPGLPTGQTRSAPTELLDIVPTVLDLAGVAAPHQHFGRNLVPLMQDAGHAHRQYAFSEGGFSVWEEPQLEDPPFPYDIKGALQHEDPRLVGRSIAVRNERYSYIWRLYEEPELYDRHSDPDETDNLARGPHLAELEREFQSAILRWQVETSDVLPADADPRSPSVDLPRPGSFATVLRPPPRRPPF